MSSTAVPFPPPTLPAAPLPEAVRTNILARAAALSLDIFAIFRLPDLAVAYLNQAGLRRLAPGTPPDGLALTLPDIMGLTCTERLHAQIIPQAQVLGRWSGPCELRDPWGSEFGVTATFTPIDGHAGYIALQAHVSDSATDAHGSHFSDRELLRALLENLPDHIYFKDRASRYLRVSRAKARRSNLDDPSEAIGKTDFDFFTTEHAAGAFHDEQKILRTGEPLIDVEEKETWPDGSISWCSSTKLPLYDSERNLIGTFGISRDITARKRAEEDRREMEVQLQLAQKLESIGRLAAGIAHEVNTPNQFIADNTHFLANAFAALRNVLERHQALHARALAHPDLAQAAASVTDAESAAELDYLLAEIPRTVEQTLEGLARVARIVRSLKEFSHPNSPHLTPANLNHAIDVSVAVSRHEWKYVAQLTTELAPDLPLVPCVLDEFNQVMLNLIINAAHAIGDALKIRGGSRGTITIRTRHDSQWAIVEVEDTGTGIPPEIRSRIFEPFFTTKGIDKGSGQGLAIVHAVLVKKHRGAIEVDSEVGRGTTFRLRLPLVAAPPEPLSSAPPPEDSTHAPF